MTLTEQVEPPGTRAEAWPDEAAGRGWDRLALIEEHLEALTRAQRAQLSRRLAALNGGRSTQPGATRLRRWATIITLGATLAMVPWTYLLAVTLPDHHVARYWSVSWIGFDVLLLLSFGVTAWTTWRHRRSAFGATVVTATLLACDAWFDVTTSATAGDLLTSGLIALVGELPLAALLIYLVSRSRSRRGAATPA